MVKRAVLVTGVLLIGALLFAAGTLMAPRPAPPGGAEAVAGGPFALIDGDGRPVTDASFRGRWTLVYFGYTHCPDVCPTALQSIANALDLLPADLARRVAVVFITVDPARDTPAVMKDYVAAFGPSFIGLSGTSAAIAQAEAAYQVYAARHEEPDGGYSMDHSSVISLMDPQGRLAARFTHATEPAQIAAALRRLAG